MSPSKTILDILKQHPDSLSDWGYESPVELFDGLAFSLNTTFYHPGWIEIIYEDVEGAYFIRAVEKEHGYEQEVGFIQEVELFDVLKKVIEEGLTNEEIEDIRRRWWNAPSPTNPSHPRPSSQLPLGKMSSYFEMMDTRRPRRSKNVKAPETYGVQGGKTYRNDPIKQLNSKTTRICKL